MQSTQAARVGRCRGRVCEVPVAGDQAMLPVKCTYLVEGVHISAMSHQILNHSSAAAVRSKVQCGSPGLRTPDFDAKLSLRIKCATA